MKYTLPVICCLLSVLCLTSCEPEAHYDPHFSKVNLSMQVDLVSAAYMRVHFETDRAAYYLVACEEVIPGADPEAYPDQTMKLAADSAYMEYIIWRHDLLMDGIHDIAEFHHHSLQYGKSDIYFQFLKPDTEYWVFCFVVDPETCDPQGELHIQTVRTAKESQIPVYFNYRINGRWDYIYPIDTTGQLLTDVPWVVATLDSVRIREEGWPAPGICFADSFSHISYDKKARVLFGVYSHNNDGVGDGTSTTNFQEGHTYYTAMASLDGMTGGVPTYYDIFRFRWEGKDTKLMLYHDKDNTRGNW